MPHHLDRPRWAASNIRAWLPANPSGVPRRQALLRALIGVGLGIGIGSILWALNARDPTGLTGTSGLHLVLSSISGAIAGPLGVVVVARLLDRTIRAEDQLIGYSGLIRMLLHAGELSFLGALAGGAGAGAAMPLRGLVAGVVLTGLVGAILYRVRGLGLLLGLTIGIITGGIGGVLGGLIHSLGG